MAPVASSVSSEQAGSGTARPKGASGLRQRRTGATASRSSGSRMGGGGSMWRFYTEDSPGIKIGPLPVLVFSLAFIAFVFIMHIWGKLMRATSN